jgi:hypothetical protein
MEKGFRMYKAFLSFTENVKREANSIPLVFGFVFKAPSYYTPDPKLEKTLQRCMDGAGDFEDEDFDMGGQEDFAEFDEQMDNRQQFAEDPDSADEDYDLGGIDILSDVREAERYATQAPVRRSTGAVEEEKIEGIDINDYNTAALDDLLEGPKPQRSSATVVENRHDMLATADPFAEPNDFSDTPKPEYDPFAEEPKPEQAINDGG